MNKISPTAHIGEGVQLGEGNEIGARCHIEDGVVLGNNNRLWMNVYLGPGTTLGDDNKIHMGAVLGHEPQDLAFEGKPSFTRIGNRNIIREYSTVHRGTQEGSSTVIGDDNFLMAGAHVAHNCILGNRIIMCNLASLTGHTTLEDGVVMLGLSGTHQHTRIGTLALIAGLSGANKDVPPYMMAGGRPAVVQGLNVVGMRRGGIGPAIREEIKRAHKLLYRSGLNVTNAIAAIEKECHSEEVAHMVQFVKTSKRGLSAGVAGKGSETATNMGPRKSLTPSEI